MNVHFKKLAEALLLAAVAVAILAYPVQLLWNDLMPELFGLIKITYTKAVEINILTGLLFRIRSGKE